jgi:hypothetical protein
MNKEDKDPFQVFMDNWSNGWINKKKEDLQTNTKIVYAERDFDKDLLTAEDIIDLDAFAINNDLYKATDDPIELYKECLNRKKQQAYKEYNELHNQYLNYANWLCMARKAPLMIQAFKEEILPRIVKVHSTQKHIKLENEDGDITQGYIDMVVELDDGKTYVLDLKTSSRKYDEDSAKWSPQLSLYAYHEDIENIGFVVLYKNIKKEITKTCVQCGFNEENNRVKSCSNKINGKRCGGDLDEKIKPVAVIDLILDKRDDNFSNAVIENFDTVNTLISSKMFYKNFDSCENWYGQRCPYFDKCFANSDKGLIKE